MTESIKKKTIAGTFWVSIDKFGSLSIQFFTNLILARLLFPSDFGYIGLLYIFLAVSQTLIDGGFGTALIQKKEPTKEDYSTIFIWNILLSFFLYFILYISSPYIAKFYDMPLLDRILKVLGITVIINSFNIVQTNRLRKQLAFKQLSIINITAYILSGIVGVYMAYTGNGVWSLVIMHILYSSFTTIFLWGFIRWRPSIYFSITILKDLFGFGGYLLLSNIMQEISKNLQGLIIGRKFSSVEMGLYSQAKKLNDITSNTFPSIFVQVMFPVYSQLQNDHERLKETLRKNIQIISFVTYPIITLLIIFGLPIIEFLYGEKWFEAVPYFQILCIGGFFASLQNINYYVIASLGKSGILFKWSFYKWGVLCLLLLIGMNWGVFGILWGMVLSAINIYIVNAMLVSKFIQYTLKEQLKNIIPIFVLSIISGIIIVLLFKLTPIPVLILICLYIITYCILAYLFLFKVMAYCKDIINGLIKK